MFAIAVVLQRVLLAQWHLISPEGVPGATKSDRDRALGGNPFAGFMLVIRNPYLIGIMLFVIGVSAINTFLYFEQLQLVEEQFAEITKRTQVFASLDALVQALVVVSQLFLTGFIATRLGIIVLLVTVPIVMVFGLTVFAISGTFIVLAVAMVIRRWGEYAFIRPGREMLFSKVADAGFAQLKKFLEAVGMSGTAEALTTAGIAALWAINGWWLGRRYEKEKEHKSGV
jgi:AAA family ATP:ADP antiporter